MNVRDNYLQKKNDWGQLQESVVIMKDQKLLLNSTAPRRWRREMEHIGRLRNAALQVESPWLERLRASTTHLPQHPMSIGAKRGVL